jgi:phenylpyruvate tautomerase PptA (4-oxalocrotonate tautomerase family)
MPLLDVIYPAGALSDDARRELLASLWSTCLRWEGITANDATASISWVYLDERARDSIAVGGHPLTQTVYRAHVRVMSGFMDQERVDGMVRDVTAAILRADGSEGDGRPRVFCIVEEVPSGTWGVDGSVWHSSSAAEIAGLDAARVEGIRQAVKANPRIEVSLTGRTPL